MTFSTGIVENHNYNGHLIVWQTKTQDFAFAPKRCLAKILALNWHSWFNTAGYIKGAQNVIGYDWSNGGFISCRISSAYDTK